jgi:hypothetical protein
MSSQYYRPAPRNCCIRMPEPPSQRSGLDMWRPLAAMHVLSQDFDQHDGAVSVEVRAYPANADQCLGLLLSDTLAMLRHTRVLGGSHELTRIVVRLDASVATGELAVDVKRTRIVAGG